MIAQPQSRKVDRATCLLTFIDVQVCIIRAVHTGSHHHTSQSYNVEINLLQNLGKFQVIKLLFHTTENDGTVPSCQLQQPKAKVSAGIMKKQLPRNMLNGDFFRKLKLVNADLAD